MKLLATESDHVEGEEPGCPPRLDFRGRLHDVREHRWLRGWKVAPEQWEPHVIDRPDKSDCMRGGSFRISRAISSLGESDFEAEFCHGVAMHLSGGSRVEMPPGILEAITASRSILELEDDWDDQGSPRYSETTWQRATDFLVRQADFARASLGRELPVPKILPGPQASIDLHWKLAGFELLVNIPSDAGQPTTFYGDDYRNSCIRGNLNPAEEIRGLVVWLLT